MDEILNLIESVSESFPSYFSNVKTVLYKMSLAMYGKAKLYKIKRFSENF